MTNTKHADAMAEVLEYLKGIRQEDIDKIPKKVLDYIEENANKDYVCNFSPADQISQMDLLPESKVMIAAICYSYWCENEIEKESLRKIIDKNENLFEQEQKELYNADNLFPKEETKEEKIEEVALAKVEKESILQRIIRKIKKLFKRG